MTTDVAAGSRRYNPGLGDVLVACAFLVLAWVAVRPHLVGRSLASDETAARAALRALGEAAEQSGLLAALDRCAAEAAKLAGLRPFDGDSRGPAFLPTWEDDGYYYRLALSADALSTGILEAVPQRPGLTGRVALRADVAGPIVEVALPQPAPIPSRASADAGENAARRRIGELARIAAGADWPGAVARFGERSASLPGISPVAGGSTGGHSLPTWRVHETYRIRLWIIRGTEPEARDLAFLAWPESAEETGFAAYRLTRTGMRQSRNMVRRYSGTAAEPRPGAGLMRPGSRPDGNGGYTGLDGNRWFPVGA